MKKIMKSKKGFTLIEMIIVIAIILILAAVVIYAVSEYLDAADDTADTIEDGVSVADSVLDYAQNRASAT